MENTAGAGEDTILAQVRRFSAAHGKELTVAGTRWRYYRLGSGPAVVWLTGGLRRAALGFAFTELMACRYTILAPDNPPMRTAAEFDRGLSAILRAEGIGRFHLVCQSYGGMLGQCYLARHPEEVDRLVLSSTDDLLVAPIRGTPDAAPQKRQNGQVIEQTYGVSRDTVRRTMALLREEGVVFTVPHRGTYVGPRP
jgi:pimeloyl-ACP methyl ester carboxylesterase